MRLELITGTILPGRSLPTQRVAAHELRGQNETSLDEVEEDRDLSGLQFAVKGAHQRPSALGRDSLPGAPLDTAVFPLFQWRGTNFRLAWPMRWRPNRSALLLLPTLTDARAADLSMQVFPEPAPSTWPIKG